MKHLKLWLARNEGKEEEYVHDRYTHVDGELLVCLDKPILKFDPDELRNKWMYSRIMCEAPSYMFPEIDEGTWVEFSYKDLECLIEEENGKA